MESDEEDFVFFGTPIEREEEIASRKKKAVAEASGNMRSLPVWKQEVTDEEGRRRFHGAFTGGFSAGYYNTVGSREGWTPQSFTSSRKNRAAVRMQSISDFLDEDEKGELEGQSLATSSQFDTFGFTAAEYARKEAEKEQHQRPSVIPGPVPNELVVPVSESIGVKLLLKMGWRRGHSIKDLRASSDARREARKAFFALSAGDKMKETTDSGLLESEVETSLEPLVNDDIQFSESTPVYVLNPKQDLYGLGYDPFKHAPEFRERKRSRMSASKELGYRKPLSMKESLFGSKSGKIAPGFGIGALEELDVEDEDVYAGYDFEETYVEDEEPSRPSIEDKPRLTSKEHDVLPGFRVASSSDYNVERFNPPKIPKDFVARHKFPGPLETGPKSTVSAPPDVPPPEDNNLKLLIDGVATLVSRSGKLFEDLSRQKNRSNPLFDFLGGGNGHDYYARRLWEEQQKRIDQNKPPLDGRLSPSMQKMTAETRGRLLGERPLERSLKDAGASASSGVSIQFPANLSDTFTKPAFSQEALEVVKPFRDDPAKQERFEQFLKEKYQGGLRAMVSGRVNNMSEAARARERLDFEAATEALEKGKVCKEGKQTREQPVDVLAGGLQFTSGGTDQGKDAVAEDAKLKKTYPTREEFQWRPAPILCKRFDLVDPYMGKPPPAPRPRSKMDSLIFLPDSVKAAAESRESLSANWDSNSQEPKKDTSAKEPEVEVQAENVERPVDLYKAIFSDDSEDEEATNIKRPEDLGKKNQAAATTLNRLIAGDFLESLGKELGLGVPPDVVHPETKTFHKEGSKAKPMEEDKPSKAKSEEGSSRQGPDNEPQLEEIAQGAKKKNDLPSGCNHSSSEDEKSRKKREKLLDRCLQSDSSGDEQRRKRSERHKRRSSNSDRDSSSDYRDRHGSRSKERRKKSSREKSGSRKKHSKDYKHRRSKKSSSRYSTDTDEEAEESRREKRRRD